MKTTRTTARAFLLPKLLLAFSLLSAPALLPAATTYVYPQTPYPFYWDPSASNSTATGGDGTWNMTTQAWYSPSTGNRYTISQTQLISTITPPYDQNDSPYSLIFPTGGTVTATFASLLTDGPPAGYYLYNDLTFTENYTIQSGLTSQTGTTIGTGNNIFTVNITAGKTLNVGGNGNAITLQSGFNVSVGPNLNLGGGGTFNFLENSGVRNTSGNARVTVIDGSTVNFLAGSQYTNMAPGATSGGTPTRLAINDGIVNIDNATIYTAGGPASYDPNRAQGFIIGNNAGPVSVLPLVNINSGTVKAIAHPGNTTSYEPNMELDHGIAFAPRGTATNNYVGGTLNLNGGTLATTSIGANSAVTATTTAIFNFNGGILYASTEIPSAVTANRIRYNLQARLDNFITGFKNTDDSHVAILDGGLNIDTSQIDASHPKITDPTATIRSVLRGTGNLTKLGQYNIRLSANNTYTGQTLLNAGNLIVTGSITSDTTAQPATNLITQNATLQNITLIGNSTLNVTTTTAAGILTIDPATTINLDLANSTTATPVLDLAALTQTTPGSPIAINLSNVPPTGTFTLIRLATPSATLTASHFNITGIPTGILWSFDGQNLLIGTSISVIAPTVVTQPPPTQTVLESFPASITATINGTGPITYQWQKDGAPVPNSNSPTLSFTSIQLTDAGNYTLTATNSAGSTTTNPSTLIVDNYLPPVFTKDLPDTYSIKTNSTLSLSVKTTGASPITYQWFKNNNPIPNATTASLKISKAQETDSGNYHVEAANAYNTTLSNLSDVWVGSIPTITTQPLPATIKEGESNTFTVTANGTPTLSYQWLKNGKPIANATLDTLTIDRAIWSDNGTYTVKVSNRAGTTTSKSARLSVLLPPIFAKNLNAKYSIETGKTLALSVSVTSPSTVTYQWLLGDTPLNDGATTAGSIIKGAKTKKLTISNITLSDAANYSVNATNNVTTFTSNTAIVWVGVRPKITTDLPKSLPLVPAGNSTTLSVDAIGTDIVFQWYKNNGGLNATASYQRQDPNYHGGNSTLTVNTTGTYYLKITNRIGSTSSRKLKVTVVDLPSIAKNLPLTAAFATNSTLSLAFSVKSQTTPSYQWLYGTTNTTLTNLPGATRNYLKITKAQPSHSGYYNATATNIAGTSPVSPFTYNAVIVLPNGSKTSGDGSPIYTPTEVWVGAPPKILKQPKSLTAHAGDTITFTSNTTGGDPLKNQWFFNTSTTLNATTVNITTSFPYKQLTGLSGYDTQNLTITDITPAHAGSYRLHVSNPLKTLMTSKVKLTVKLAPANIAGKTLRLQDTGNITLTDATTFNATFGNSSLNGIYTYKNTSNTAATLSLIYDTYDPAALDSPIKLAFKTYLAGGTYSGTFTAPGNKGNFTLSNTTAPAPAPLATNGNSTLNAATIDTNNTSPPAIIDLPGFSLTTLTLLRNALSSPEQIPLDPLLFTFTPDDPIIPPTTFPITGTSTLTENNDGTLTLSTADGTSTYQLREDGSSTHTDTSTGASTPGTFTISK